MARDGLRSSTAICTFLNRTTCTINYMDPKCYRLDERSELRKEFAREPLSLKPSEYFLRQCFISVDVDEDIVADVIRRIGDDNIVISTDYPHADSHWPHAIDSFMAIDGINSNSRRKILWENCARLYGIDD